MDPVGLPYGRLSSATEWNAREHAATARAGEEAAAVILNVFATSPKHGFQVKANVKGASRAVSLLVAQLARVCITGHRHHRLRVLR